jgi:hypothetical protein
MLRDRHSGLPVALDREIISPTEFVHKVNEKAKEMDEERRVQTPITGQGERLPSVSEGATV